MKQTALLKKILTHSDSTVKQHVSNLFKEKDPYIKTMCF